MPCAADRIVLCARLFDNKTIKELTAGGTGWYYTAARTQTVNNGLHAASPEGKQTKRRNSSSTLSFVYYILLCALYTHTDFGTAYIHLYYIYEYIYEYIMRVYEKGANWPIVNGYIFGRVLKTQRPPPRPFYPLRRLYNIIRARRGKSDSPRGRRPQPNIIM